MIITYLRSSSYGTHSMCEQQYFIEYVLGLRSPSNKKADKGTIVHKVLEILALMKYGEQNSLSSVDDDILGNIDLKLNRMHDAIFVHSIIDRVYDYYTSQFTHHEWMDIDKKDCVKWVSQALTHNNRMFDPRHRIIVKPEQQFDITINKDWAKYSFKTKDGELNGNLAIKGTIDLITEVNENTLEIIDWKTGKRLDWATGEIKTPEKLQKDAQLRMYHYAVNSLYPQYDHVIVSINFINDGGPFSICFDKSDLYETENMLRKKFETIKNATLPRLNRTWKCNKLCHFGKTNFNNSNIEPIQEYRKDKITPVGNTMCKCEQIKHDTDLHGIDHVVDKYSKPGYNVAFYKAPGSVE
jgi:hypothetical protein